MPICMGHKDCPSTWLPNYLYNTNKIGELASVVKLGDFWGHDLSIVEKYVIQKLVTTLITIIKSSVAKI